MSKFKVGDQVMFKHCSETKSETFGTDLNLFQPQIVERVYNCNIKIIGDYDYWSEDLWEPFEEWAKHQKAAPDSKPVLQELEKEYEPSTEYELWQDDMCVAGTSGKDAYKGILHYAAVYGQDGPVEVFEVVRKKVEIGLKGVADLWQEERFAYVSHTKPASNLTYTDCNGDTKPLNQGQLHELEDRIHCFQVMLDHLLQNHPAGHLVAEELEAAQEKLGEACQKAGEISFEMFEEDE